MKKITQIFIFLLCVSTMNAQDQSPTTTTKPFRNPFVKDKPIQVQTEEETVAPQRPTKIVVEEQEPQQQTRPIRQREQEPQQQQNSGEEKITKTVNYNQEDLEDGWVNFTKLFESKKGKVKTHKKSNTYETINCFVSDLGGNTPIDLFATFKQTGKSCTISIWYTPNLTQRTDVQMVNNIGQFYDDFISEVEKTILEKDMDVLHYNIENLSKGITKNLDGIDKNNNENQKYRNKIEDNNTESVKFKSDADRKKSELENTRRTYEKYQEKYRKLSGTEYNPKRA